MFNQRVDYTPIALPPPASGFTPSRPAPPPVYQIESEFQEEAAGRDLLEWWGIFRRRLVVILTLGLLGALTGYLLCLPQKTLYRARASLQFQTPQETVQTRDDTGAQRPSSGIDETTLQTEIKVLQSETLARRVVAKLQLGRRQDYYTLPSMVSALKKFLGLHITEPDPDRRALMVLQDNTKVHPAGQTRIVEILCDAPDPALAASIANAFSGEFIAARIEARKNNNQQNNTWLAEQLYRPEIQPRGVRKATPGVCRVLQSALQFRYHQRE